MENNTRDVYSYVIPDVPLESLLGQTDTQRVQPWQNLPSNVDMRDGNITIRDASNTRIVIGQLPDGSYGWAVSRVGHNVSEIFA